MEPISPHPATDLPPDADLADAENTVAAMGERVLVERLHRVLDEGGITAHTAFCATTLPYLQGLVELLPGLVQEGSVKRDAVGAVERLTATAQANGVAIQDAIAEGSGLHEALVTKVMAQLRERDRPLVIMLNHLGSLLLESTRGLVAGVEPAVETVSPALGRTDAHTGLHTHDYFDERFGEEILRAQRAEKALALVLLHVEDLPGEQAGLGSGEASLGLRRVAAALLSQTRGFDLATRLSDEKFALLLPDTDRAGALAIVTRLARGTEERPDWQQALHFRAGVAVYPADGKTAHELIAHADGVLQSEAGGATL